MPRPVFGIVSDEEEDVEEVDARRSCTKYTDNVYHVEWENAPSEEHEDRDEQDEERGR
jgi:hypothetical protein